MRAGRASATAQVVAAALLCLEHDASRAALLPPDPADWRDAVLGGTRGTRALRRSAHAAWTRRGWTLLASALLPDIMAHYAARKARIEQHVRDRIGSDVTRIMVLGAGLDTLALRLAPEFPDVEWIELDHPATQALKLAGIHGRPLPRNLAFASHDLTDARLALPSGTRSTLVVAEGLLMYLPAERIDALIASARTASPAGAQWILTYMRTGSDGRGRFEPSTVWIDRWLRWRGEPFVWAMDADEVDAWARRRRLEVVAHERSPFVTVPGAQSSTLRGENLLVLRDG